MVKSGGKRLKEELTELLRELHLQKVRTEFEEMARLAENQSFSFEQYLGELIRRECEERRVNRIARLLRQSKIPPEKTLEAFEMPRLPRKVSRQVKTLLAGDFLDRAENVLVFGRSGTGKTHLLCGLGQELIRQGRRVHFTTCSLLVQELLIAKRDLKLSRAIRRFAKCDALIIDDIGYVQQSRDEMEVLFTLLAERYERGSVLLTSNLAFSKWEQIFKDPMTTAAAIDRLVHHSVILEMNVGSYRLAEAKDRTETEKSGKKPRAAKPPEPAT